MEGQQQEPLQSHDTWESWESPEVSHFSDWYQSEVDQIMEERNKLYAERRSRIYEDEHGDLPLYTVAH